MADKYPKTRAELFDFLAPTINETVRYRVGRYLQELHGAPAGDLHRLVVAQAEQATIAVVLEHTGGNQALAAEYLGISRPTLRNKVQGT